MSSNFLTIRQWLMQQLSGKWACTLQAEVKPSISVAHELGTRTFCRKQNHPSFPKSLQLSSFLGTAACPHFTGVQNNRSTDIYQQQTVNRQLNNTRLSKGTLLFPKCEWKQCRGVNSRGVSRRLMRKFSPKKLRESPRHLLITTSLDSFDDLGQHDAVPPSVWQVDRGNSSFASQGHSVKGTDKWAQQFCWWLVFSPEKQRSRRQWTRPTNPCWCSMKLQVVRRRLHPSP